MCAYFFFPQSKATLTLDLLESYLKNLKSPLHPPPSLANLQIINSWTDLNKVFSTKKEKKKKSYIWAEKNIRQVSA